MERRKLNVLALVSLIVGILAFASAIMAPVQAFNCKIVQCPAPQCDDNQHLQVPAGQCCPVCVNN
jgi:hypothetical protein